MAEPQSIALSLVEAGFWLHAVVVVMDAEAARDTLLGQEVARQQLSVADMVVINKCDLVDLAQV